MIIFWLLLGYDTFFRWWGVVVGDGIVYAKPYNSQSSIIQAQSIRRSLTDKNANRKMDGAWF